MKIICERGFKWSDGGKGKKKPELVDLYKKAAAMKQIKIASSAKDRKKLLEEKLQTSEGKFAVPKFFNAWTYHFSNIPEPRVSLVLMSLFNRSFTSCKIIARAYCSLRNEIETCRLLDEFKLCNFRNGNLSFAKWKMCRFLIYINKIAETGVGGGERN